RLFDQCGRPFGCDTVYQDDEGSVLIAAGGTIALLDDRELARFADQSEALARTTRSEVPMRFRFNPDPTPYRLALCAPRAVVGRGLKPPTTPWRVSLR